MCSLPPADSELWDAPDVSLITGDLDPHLPGSHQMTWSAQPLTLKPQLELAESSPAGECVWQISTPI